MDAIIVYNTIEELIADDMLEIAFSLSRQSSAYLVIDAAKRVHSGLDIEKVKRDWLEQHLENERIHRMNIPVRE